MGKIARITNDGKVLLAGEIIKESNDNLVIKSEVLMDTYVNHLNGNVISYNGHVLTGFINTSINKILTFQNEKGVSQLRVLEYDENMEYLKGANTGASSSGFRQITVPQETRYMRVCFRNTDSTPVNLDKLEIKYFYEDGFATSLRNGNLIINSEFIEKGIAPPSLSFNNDYLQLPLINSVRSVMMKIKIPTQDTTRWGYVIDARSGLAAGYMGTGGAGGDFVKMYIDGNLAPNVSWANIPKDKWISFYIEGKDNFNDDINIFSRSGSIQGVVGELREVQVWNKVLSQEEIIAYGEGVSGEEEGLLAYYPVTSTTSDTLIDVVNNYHGQISPRVILKKDNAILRLRSNSLELYGEIIENSNLE